jgi:hypothetical protein
MCPFKVTQLQHIALEDELGNIISNHWRGNGGLRMTEMTSSEPQKIQEKQVETNARFRYLMKGWKDSGEIGFSLHCSWYRLAGDIASRPWEIYVRPAVFCRTSQSSKIDLFNPFYSVDGSSCLPELITRDITGIVQTFWFPPTRFDACTFGTHMFLASPHLCDLEYCHTIDHAVACWLIVQD